MTQGASEGENFSDYLNILTEAYFIPPDGYGRVNKIGKG